MQPHIEVVLATIGSRDSISQQIESIRAQTYKNYRLTILADGFGDRVRSKVGPLRENERIVDVPEGPRGNVGHPAVRWATENLDLHGWLYVIGDDDYTYPDALQNFVDAMDGVSMVIGVVKAVSRTDPNAFVRWLGDERIEVCHVTGSCCVYNLDSMKQLEAPWYRDSTYDSDWQLINRMMQRFPHKRITNVVYRLAFS
jgi:glycosyltransferase involved in cell wall biosynthesis